MSAAPIVIPFVNITTEEIPGGAVLEPAGGYDANGRMRMQKCTRDANMNVWFNSPMPVPYSSGGLADEAKEGGYCHAAWPMAAAAIHPDDAAESAAATFGLPCGTRAGDWFLRLSSRGFRWVGSDLHGMAQIVADPSADRVRTLRVTGPDEDYPGLFPALLFPYQGYIAGANTWADSVEEVWAIAGPTGDPLTERVYVSGTWVGGTWGGRPVYVVDNSGTIITGNASAEATGSTASIATYKLEAVKPLRARGPADARTVALIPPTEEDAGYDTLDVVTSVCPRKKRWRYYWMDGETKVPVVAEEVAEEDDDYETAQEVQIGDTVQKTALSVIPLGIGETNCVDDPSDCCPVASTECLCGEIWTDIKLTLRPLYVHFKNVVGNDLGLMQTTFLMTRSPDFATVYSSWAASYYYPSYTYIQFATDGCVEIKFLNAWLNNAEPTGESSSFTPAGDWETDYPPAPAADSFLIKPASFQCASGQCFGTDDVNNFEEHIGTVTLNNFTNQAVQTLPPYTGSFDVYVSTYPRPLP
jgi:hypothetical protein